MNDQPLAVRKASVDEAEAVTAVLTQAFLQGDLAALLVPSADDRDQIYPDYFAMVTAQAFRHGWVEITNDQMGVALWYDLGEGKRMPEVDGYDDWLAAVTGDHAPQFAALDAAMARRHPTQAHHYLAYLAVHPDRQGHGYGTQLLRHHAHELDRRCANAYLEATGIRNCALYRIHGYRPVPPPEPIADGERLIYPMWREPSVCAHP